MRANAAINELRHVERLTSELYRQQLMDKRKSAQNSFVLHDGPPYANGSLHLGHFLNKVLKDTANRYNILRGKKVFYVPGWDCHGLPIELKALEKVHNASSASQKSIAEIARTSLSPMDIRLAARACAEDAIASQRADFIRWGIMADWGLGTRRENGNVYVTMDPEYEGEQLRVFSALLEKGLVHRDRKPVYWSPSSASALAEAELEYVDNHESIAAYIKFPLVGFASSTPSNVQKQIQEIQQRAKEENLSINALIWTTTPWTLPANVAISAHPELQYSILRVAGHGSLSSTASTAPGYYLVASDLISELESVVRKSLGLTPSEPLDSTVMGNFTGSDLAGFLFQHPMPRSALEPVPELDALQYSSSVFLSPEAQGSQYIRMSPIVLGTHVSASAGTGLVHTAPGHGHDDFNVVRAYNQTSPAENVPSLPVLTFVDNYGKFLPSIGSELQGKDIFSDGNQTCLESMRQSGNLLHSESYFHRFPYDWRTKRPVMIRATEQWFIRVDPVSSEAPEALSDVTMVPESSRSRLLAAVRGRSEWCISRQRSWGVPIPAVFRSDTGEAIISPELVQHVARLVEKEGSDVWWTRDVRDLVPSAVVAEAEEQGYELVKGMDTLDVWFDSGTAWASTWGTLKSNVLKDGVNSVESSRATNNPSDSEEQNAIHDAWRELYAVSGGQGGKDPSNSLGLGFRSDMVIEGSDQHRGWFQSLLITSLASTGHAPYKSIITHGFVLDEAGRKMSKSLGNVIVPHDVIYGTEQTVPAQGKEKSKGKVKDAGKSAPETNEQSASGYTWPAYGVDVLRYWVAGSDYSKDVTIGPEIVSRVSESLRKVRNTARFLLGGLDQFNPLQLEEYETKYGSRASETSAQLSQSASSGMDTLQRLWSTPTSVILTEPRFYEKLRFIDKAFLSRLYALHEEVQGLYQQMGLEKITYLVNQFASRDLSSGYCDIVKDSLYNGYWNEEDIEQLLVASNDKDAGRVNPRLASQLVMWECVKEVTRMLAPIVPFVAEEIYQNSISMHPQLLAAQIHEFEQEQSKIQDQKVVENEDVVDKIIRFTTEPKQNVENAKKEYNTSNSTDALEPVLSKSTVFHSLWHSLPSAWRDIDDKEEYVPALVRTFSAPSASGASTVRLPTLWNRLFSFKSEVLRGLEHVRAQKHIGNASDATLHFFAIEKGGEVELLLRSMGVAIQEQSNLDTSTNENAPEAAEFFGVSQLYAYYTQPGEGISNVHGGDQHSHWTFDSNINLLVQTVTDINVPNSSQTYSERFKLLVEKTNGNKCPRCKLTQPEVNPSSETTVFCNRCTSVLNRINVSVFED